MRKFIDQVRFRMEQGWGLIDALSLTNWLRGVQSGKQRERERIIKLLEPLAKHQDLCAKACYPEDCSAPIYQFAIDLIKGEQK